MKYRKKPVVIEAMRLPRNGYENREAGLALLAWLDGYGAKYSVHPTGDLFIHTLEGDMHVSPCDYVIRGVQGEFYPCKPDIFEMTYEKVEE